MTLRFYILNKYREESFWIECQRLMCIKKCCPAIISHQQYEIVLVFGISDINYTATFYRESASQKMNLRNYSRKGPGTRENVKKNSK